MWGMLRRQIPAAKLKMINNQNGALFWVFHHKIKKAPIVANYIFGARNPVAVTRRFRLRQVFPKSNLHFSHSFLGYLLNLRSVSGHSDSTVAAARIVAL